VGPAAWSNPDHPLGHAGQDVVLLEDVRAQQRDALLGGVGKRGCIQRLRLARLSHPAHAAPPGRFRGSGRAAPRSATPGWPTEKKPRPPHGRGGRTPRPPGPGATCLGVGRPASGTANLSGGRRAGLPAPAPGRSGGSPGGGRSEPSAGGRTSPDGGCHGCAGAGCRPQVSSPKGGAACQVHPPGPALSDGCSNRRLLLGGAEARPTGAAAPGPVPRAQGVVSSTDPFLPLPR
jgi:hypothetical protein